MAKNDPGNIVPSSGGFVQELALRIKLIYRLMMDKRVSVWLKLLPVGSVIYLINPIDIPGPIDDAAVVGLGFYLFIELCPSNVVEEHMKQLRNEVHVKVKDSPEKDNFVEGEFKDVDEKKP
jgi:uncharacterized membrane protein YkvA (DUF1232 family)